MRKISICAVLAAAVILSSCGRKNDEKIVDENGREVIILARNRENQYSRDTVENLIIEYNNSGDKFYIEEKDYSSGDDLITDIIAGKNIDVLIADGWIDIAPLYSKGFLCDMYEFINNDSEITDDTYVTSVLKAMEKNGKLYEIPYDFSIESAVAKADLWGDDNDTSFEHIIEKANELNCEIPFDMSVDSYSFITYITSNYVDLINNSCNFNDGGFEKFIVFMKQYYDNIKNLSNEDLYNKFKNNDLLVMSAGFAGFDQIDYLESDVGDKIKFVGFPSDINNYHIAVPDVLFSIFSDSQNSDGAFDFIKYCTSYEAYIDSTNGVDLITKNFTFPINREVLEYLYNDSIRINMYQIDKDLKKSYNDEIMKQIDSVNGSACMANNAIGDILSEELHSYFDDGKNSGEVCSSIQNRVTIYLNERS